MAKRCRYQSGDIFAMPLDNGQYCIGVIARGGERGRAGIVAYLFPFLFDKVPALIDLTELVPGRAKRSMLASSLYLKDGRWPILGRVPDWNPERWPIPDFAELSSSGVPLRRVRYSERDLVTVIGEWPLTTDDVSLSDSDLYGARAAEIRMTIELLGEDAVDESRTFTNNPVAQEAVRKLHKKEWGKPN